jgi:type IV pilus assembly protein PilM
VPGVPLVPVEPAPVESAPVVPVPELPLDAVASAEPEQPPAPSPPPLSTLSADVVASPEQPSVPEAPAQPESVQLAPVPPPIQLAPEPVELPPLAAAADPVDSWLASAELPPALAGPLPAAVHPPVTAAELAPVVEPHVPFWKKEVSLSRKRKESLEPELAGPVAAGGPWWKKELSLSRKPKPAAAEATADVVAVEPAAKTPWWKKEIGGRKTGAVATAEGAPTEVDVPPKAPFWKRGLAMGTPKLPKGSAKAGGKKGSKGAKRLVGLKIGGSQIAAARVSNNGVAELEQVARQALPMGIVVGGELRDPDALADALKVFFAKNKLPKKGVRLGIANNRIGVRIFDIVGVDEDKQLANAIHFRAQEALPIPLDEAVLDYHVLDESVDAEGRKVRRVLLVVAYKELIDRYVGACRKAGITLAGIDLEAFALLRSLSPPTDGGSAALVAVAIGYDRSTFAVSDGRVCEFTRVLEWGGWSLNIALARAFDTAPSEVEALKCALSLDGSIAPDDLSAEQTALAVETVRRQVQSFARELVSSLQFYQNQPGSLGIGEIVITGGTAQLPGLAEELEKLIGVRVRLGNPLARLKVAKRVSAPAQQIGSLAVAIGLGIED